MLLISLGLGFGFDLFATTPSWLSSFDTQASLLAFLVALSGAILMLWLSDKVSFLRDLYDELSGALPERDFKWNVSAGIASGFAEEFAFRGVVLALVGPYWSSLLFGLLHIGWKRSMWVWPIYAALIGWALAYFTQLTGSIWTAVVFHAVYNTVLLQAMGTGLGDRK